MRDFVRHEQTIWTQGAKHKIVSFSSFIWYLKGTGARQKYVLLMRPPAGTQLTVVSRQAEELKGHILG